MHTINGKIRETKNPLLLIKTRPTLPNTRLVGVLFIYDVLYFKLSQPQNDKDKKAINAISGETKVICAKIVGSKINNAQAINIQLGKRDFTIL